jgi:hypothetical protein
LELGIEYATQLDDCVKITRSPEVDGSVQHRCISADHYELHLVIQQPLDDAFKLWHRI